MMYIKNIQEYIKNEIEVLSKIDLNCIDLIMKKIEETWSRNNVVYICGNGGSAATASHFCCDFNKGVSGLSEKSTNFVCLNDNIPTITAIANDVSYEEIFSYQLRNRLRPGDLLIVISGSGNSKNIVKAMEIARKKGNYIIGLCGYSGGKVKEMSDLCFHVQIDNMQIVEDIHMFLDHCMMYIFSNCCGSYK